MPRKSRANRLKRVLTAPIRTLPNFLIIGAQKSGTTSLYNYLTHHPCIAEAKRKEVHYFDLYFNRGLLWYRTHFPSKLSKWLFYKLSGHQLIGGEASPYYLYHPRVPERVHMLLPDVKLIVLLRNPVDRAYSHFQHVQRTFPQFETLSFEEAIEMEEARLDGIEEMFRTGEMQHSEAHQHYSYLSRGLYAKQLQRWQRHFSKQQMLVLQSEEFFDCTQAVLQRVFEFLETPKMIVKDLKAQNRGTYQEMDPDTRNYLVDYYQPHNQELYEMLGRDFRWE